MVSRTRYKVNSPTYYLNTGSNVNVLQKYSEYYVSGKKYVANNTNSVAYGLANPNVITMTDMVYTATEKNLIGVNGKRKLKSKNVHSWVASFSATPTKTTPAVAIRIDNPTLTPARPVDYLSFTGLPAEARTGWGFMSSEFLDRVNLLREDFHIPKENVLSAYQRMMSDASLLNLHDQNLFTTLGELKDFKKTIETITKHKHFSEKEYVADKYLGVNFGMLPFYSDMKNYIENYNNFGPALKKWNNKSEKGKVFNKHRTIFKQESKDEFQITSGSYTFTGGTVYKYIFEYTVETKYKHLAHTYFRTKGLEAEDRARLIRSINGLSKPVSAAWNLIPFSFVVDWFINVGDQIDNLEYSKPTVRFDIEDGCYSEKVSQLMTCNVYHYIPSTGLKTYLGRSSMTRNLYNRIPTSGSFIKDVVDGIYGGIGPLELKTELSGYQWSLAAALAVTFKKR